MRRNEEEQKKNTNECPCSLKRLENSKKVDEAFEIALAKFRSNNSGNINHNFGPLSNNPRILSLINAQ